MSRIGKEPIKIPDGVTAEVKDGYLIVRGQKGELKRKLHESIKISIEKNIIVFDIKNKNDKSQLSLWGTFAAHARNMINGVTNGFKKQLEVNGVGYRVSAQGKDLKLEVGFSHPVIFKLPKEVNVSIEKNIITFDSADIELLGMIVAKIRSIRKPEPYKGKGIKYVDEVIRRKAGKAAKASAG